MKTQRRLCSLAVSVLVLLTFQLAQAAFADTVVNLVPEHVGATNPGFEVDENDCGPDPQGAFMWRFALVWLDPGTPPGVLTARFEHSGVIQSSSPVLFGGGNMQKFWVYTDVPDTLLEASATVPTAQSGDPREPALKLSGVMQGCAPPPAVLSTAGVQLGACAFDDESRTPATISISPPGGATVTVRDQAEKVVATTSQTTTLSLAPGTFHWTAVAAEGRTLTGAASGTITAHACAPVLPSGPPKVLPTKLPATGASGLLILTAVGFAFIGAGALMVTADRRRPLWKPARGWWRPVSTGMSEAAAWLLRTYQGPVIALSRRGVWAPRFA